MTTDVFKRKLAAILRADVKSHSRLMGEDDEAIAVYNSTARETLHNVSPNDMYAGRKEAILELRLEKKRLTLERRRRTICTVQTMPQTSAIL